MASANLFCSADLSALNNAEKLVIAYSGGIDSHVLLHVCASFPQLKAKITAVYVHHGLQAQAEQWAIHCQQQAEHLGVLFQLLRVNAHPNNGQSPEEAARDVRYQALEKLISANALLLVAQHQQDQLETVLLQLFRGAGVQGLAAMPKTIAFGNGQMLRPFLNVPKQAIQDYAAAHHLRWVEDPSNQCDDFDRNFLRNQIIPLLKTRWKNVDKTVSRSANHCANAQQLLNELAESLFAEVIISPAKEEGYSKNSLSISKLLTLDTNQQALVIRHWFKVQNLAMPSTDFIENIFNTVIAAKPSAEPQLKKAGIVIRRYQDNLYSSKELLGFQNLESLVWEQGKNQILLPDNSVLQRLPAASGIPISVWQTAKITVKFRQGGEKIRIKGREGQQDLKNLLQAARIPPWERARIPLLYFDEQLVAVADLWLSASVQTECSELCYQLKWLKPA